MHSFINPEIWPYIAHAHGDESKRIELDHAIVTTYVAKLNAFTFLKGRFAIRLPIRIIGLPPSLSVPGYHVASPEGVLEITKWVQAQKGHTLILNADDTFDGLFPMVSTLPSVIMENKYTSYEAYLSELRSHYRYRLQKAKKRFSTVEIVENPPFDPALYALYEAVYTRSSYPLVKNTCAFFERFPGQITAFYAEEKPIGFCQYHISDEKLTFMFCGLDYEALKPYDTYLNLLQHLVRRGIEAGVKYIDFGQTTEEVKLKLGGKLKPLNLYYYHHNPIMRCIAKLVLPLLGYREKHPEYHVFKHQPKEAHHVQMGPI